MAYDIYGNNLRRGYCEVHPNVHEEYPCSMCYAEDRQRQSEKQRQQARPPERDYEYEISSLQSQNERLLSALKEREWIDVKERLPEKGELVLAYNPKDQDNHICVDFLYLSADGRMLWDWNTDEVTHWQPLPPPPKQLINEIEKQ